DLGETARALLEEDQPAAVKAGERQEQAVKPQPVDDLGLEGAGDVLYGSDHDLGQAEVQRPLDQPAGEADDPLRDAEEQLGDDVPDLEVDVLPTARVRLDGVGADRDAVLVRHIERLKEAVTAVLRLLVQ